MRRAATTGVGRAALLCLVGAAGCTDDPPTASPNHIDALEALIVSPDELTAELQRLADWRCRTGLSTRVVPLSDALAGGDGPDDAARLRGYLRSEWDRGTLEFVTLLDRDG